MQSSPYSATKADLSCLRVEPCIDVPDLFQDVQDGLLTTPRSLPPKYFYDEQGSLLFDQICDTPEYYPTRTEDQLLKKYADNIISTTLADEIIELGSGTSRKTRRLFDACENQQHHCKYSPFDVCEPMLLQAGNELQSEYSWLNVTPLLGDYHAGLAKLPRGIGNTLYLFLGSTIGNFESQDALEFLVELRSSMNRGDHFLIGADRLKDTQILNAAYNDDAGITAQFNLNVLNVLNRELEGDFDLDKFQHHAHYNAALGRIEMHLVSLESQRVEFGKLHASMELQKEEAILTEISRKFEFEEIESLLEQCGFQIIRHYQPDNEYFSLLLGQAI